MTAGLCMPTESVTYPPNGLKGARPSQGLCTWVLYLEVGIIFFLCHLMLIVLHRLQVGDHVFWFADNLRHVHQLAL